IERDAYIREAETVYYCLPYSASAHQRVLALMHLSSAYFNVGRVEECDELVEAALQTWECEPADRATLLNYVAALRGEQGRYTLARSLAREAALLSRDTFAEAIALHHIDAAEAWTRGQHSRAMRIFDELLRRQSREEQPLYYAYAATDAAFCAWTYGDDEAFLRYIALLEDALTPGLEPGFARMIAAARGRPIASDDKYAWPVHIAISELYRIPHAESHADALNAAWRAARAADERRDPNVRSLAYAAVYLLDEGQRTQVAETLRAVAHEIESPELHGTVEDLITGRGYGIFDPFVRCRVLRTRGEQSPPLSVELLAGRVTRDGVSVKLTSKELELAVLLAASYGPLSRDRIGEALWEHLEPEEWSNNLKVQVSRLRAKLGLRDAVVIEDGNYRLSRSVDVDLRRFENVVREVGDAPLNEKTRTSLVAILDAYGSGVAGRYERFAWMQPIIARITDIVCTAGVALARDAMRAERYADAMRFARIVVDVDHFNEAACEIIMQVAMRQGDLSAARREYLRYATALEEQLDAKPARHLTELLSAAR
ncbi:MAG TPA: BTAD domain-containing putative transcriptional regulator, partial [Vicinamibacterales bacterium]|nr:BTAD domain-containing putative transcriptional regulator [Vicinamibacterales bacterium]